MPVTRRARCCHWRLSRVREQSSETRSPVSSNVQTISFSSTLWHALASRSASSARRGSRNGTGGPCPHPALTTRLVRGRSEIPNSIRFLQDEGIRRRVAETSCPGCFFVRRDGRGVGDGNGVEFALSHRMRTDPQGQCEEAVKTMAQFVANRCHTPTEAPHEIEVPPRRATWTAKPPTRAAAPRRSGRGRSAIATPRGRRQA